MAIQLTNKLTILYESGGAFSDYSDEALNYLRDSFSLTITTSDAFYIGFTKPINVVYPEISTGNTNGGDMTVEYWNGTAWASVTNLIEDTQNFSRSGFIMWDRNLDDEEETTVNSIEQFWYRITTGTTHSSTTIDGLNLVFANDQDLKERVPWIDRHLPQGDNSFIRYHVAAARQIIQDLRTDGEFKVDVATGFLKNLTIFDLLDVSQVRYAATRLALSLIFSNASDEIDDKYQEKASDEYSAYKYAMKMFFIYLDTDDDGILDNEERTQDNNPVLLRR